MKTTLIASLPFFLACSAGTGGAFGNSDSTTTSTGTTMSGPIGTGGSDTTGTTTSGSGGGSGTGGNTSSTSTGTGGAGVDGGPGGMDGSPVDSPVKCQLGQNQTALNYALVAGCNGSPFTVAGQPANTIQFMVVVPTVNPTFNWCGVSGQNVPACPVGSYCSVVLQGSTDFLKGHCVE